MSTQRITGITLLVLTALVLALVFPTPAHAEFGTNWTAQYYNNVNLSGDPVATQTGLPGVNFTYGSGSPISGVDADNFSIRFTSTQTFAAGTYDFVVTSDDGVRVLINGATVLDRFVPRPQTTDRFTQTLTAGTHSIIIEYFETGDQAAIQFQWFLTSAAPAPVVVTPGTTQIIITPGFAAPVVPTVVVTPSGPQASITFVRGLALRTGPYLGATMVTVLGRDVASYSVTGRNRSEGIYNWYLLTTPDGRQGWASGRYLILNVDVNAIPEVGSVFDTLDGAPDIGVVAVPRANMELRSRPSIRSPRIGQVPYGEQVALIGRTVQGGRDRWYHVRRTTGEVGWIFAPYVTVGGEINAVPIR